VKLRFVTIGKPCPTLEISLALRVVETFAVRAFRLGDVDKGVNTIAISNSKAGSIFDDFTREMNIERREDINLALLAESQPREARKKPPEGSLKWRL
jgi:hypothetical protein